MKKIYVSIFLLLMTSGCGTLDDKAILINPGDSKDAVVEIMGVPQDRQFQDSLEAWQYCVSGAGFGYNDHKIIWFRSGVVSGLTTYRTQVTGCASGIRPVNWEEAPDIIVETRSR